MRLGFHTKKQELTDKPLHRWMTEKVCLWFQTMKEELTVSPQFEMGDRRSVLGSLHYEKGSILSHAPRMYRQSLILTKKYGTKGKVCLDIHTMKEELTIAYRDGRVSDDSKNLIGINFVFLFLSYFDIHLAIGRN